MGLLVVHLSLLTLLSLVVADNTIHTPMGSLVGRRHPSDIYQYKNIPYAKSPVGVLRFKKPVPYGSWSGVLNATEYGMSCAQSPGRAHLTEEHFGEDCLFLNVFVPGRLSPAANKTVMVWIHGGGFETGSGSQYDGSVLALHDVIVVTINYRLGLLGFISANDDNLPGNYGMWDQLLALQWIKDNIASFGGNSNAITIFGESAGGMSVSLLALSPKSNGLFHRVIAQSGVANSIIATEYQTLHYVKAYGKLLNCPVDPFDSASLVLCLRRKSVSEIINAQKDPSVYPTDRFHFRPPMAPVIDHDFLPRHPQDLLTDKNSESYRFFRSLDFMAGNVNKEGSLFVDSFVPVLAALFHIDTAKGLDTTTMCRAVLPGVIAELYGDHNTANALATKVLCNKYKRLDVGEQANQMTDLYGDAFFIVPTVMSLDAHSSGSSTTASYQYLFNGEFKVNVPPRPSWFTGSEHANELVYLFGMQFLPFLHIHVPNQDMALSDGMVLYWTNFAKTG